MREELEIAPRATPGSAPRVSTDESLVFATVVLVALTLALQVATAGWGALYNETDGQYAGAARVMAEGGNWLVPENNGEPRLVKPPILYWLTAASFRLFGVNEFAARLPGAVGVMIMVAGTVMIGRLLGGAKLGLVAGAILVTCLGTSTLGRIVMPEPLFCGFVVASIYAGLRALAGGGVSWTVGMWVLAALAVMTKGLHGLVYPLVIVLLYGLADRQRIRLLADPRGILLFGLLVVPWYGYIEWRFPGTLSALISREYVGHLAGTEAPATQYSNVPQWQFILLHFAWLFPWSVVILTEAARALVGRTAVADFSVRPLLRLVSIWGIVVVVPVLFAGQRQDYYAMAAWPAFALAVAAVVRRGLSMPAIGAFMVVIVGTLVALPIVIGQAASAAGVADRSTAWLTLIGLDRTTWLHLGKIGFVCLGLAALGCIGAAILVRKGRGELALWLTVGCAASVGSGAVAGYATVAPYFSVVEMRPTLRRLADQGVVVAFDGPIDTGSSLLFYGNPPILLIDNEPEQRSQGAHSANVGDTILTREDLVNQLAHGDRLALLIESRDEADWRRAVPQLGPVIDRSGTQILLAPPE